MGTEDRTLSPSEKRDCLPSVACVLSKSRRCRPPRPVHMLLATQAKVNHHFLPFRQLSSLDKDRTKGQERHPKAQVELRSWTACCGCSAEVASV